jgi:hypothetical protein
MDKLEKTYKIGDEHVADNLKEFFSGSVSRCRKASYCESGMGRLKLSRMESGGLIG